MAGEAAADHLVAGRIDAAARVAGDHGADALRCSTRPARPRSSRRRGPRFAGICCGERSIDDGLWERVARLGDGPGADQADSVPREKSGDDGDGQSAAMVGLRTVSLQVDDQSDAGRAEARPTTLPLKYTPVRPGWMMALFGFADDTAGDARRSGAGSSARDGVNDDGGPAVAENGMLVRAESDIGSNYRRVARSVGGHNQRKVRDISGGHTRVVGVAGSAIEMRTSGFEVRGLALGVLMDVQECSPGGKPLTSS